MSSAAVALVTLACLLGFALLGVFLHPFLPASHRDGHTRRVVKLGVGMVITIASLVLSLLTYSVKGNFDMTETNVRAFATSIILLDRSLRAYGPEADPARALLRGYTTQALHSTWPEEFHEPPQPIEIESARLGDELFALHDMIRRLSPTDAFHREVATDCNTQVTDMLRRRFTLIEQLRRSIPPLMLAGVISWLAIIFLSFGLNAPRNPVVFVTLTLCAMAISSSIYLIDEMDTPLTGVIKISSKPLRDALAHEER